MKEVLVNQQYECDICHGKAMYDGKTKMGPWTFMCAKCMKTYGLGLGTGLGQKLKVIKQ